MRQINLIGVHGEDLLLGVIALDLNGEQRLLNLSAKTAIRTVEEEPAGKLHRERARSLPNAAAECVAPSRFHHARQIDSPVLKEMLIFSRCYGVFQDGRNLFPGEQNAPLQREVSDLLAIVGIKLGHHIGAVVLESADFRQIRGVNKYQAARGSAQDDTCKNTRTSQESGKPASPDLERNRREWRHRVRSILIPAGLSRERERHYELRPAIFCETKPASCRRDATEIPPG